MTVTCSAAGGTGTKKYGVWYKKSTASEWTKAQDYSTNAKVTVKPNFSGEYTISVKVKDAAGKVSRKTFTVKVTAPTLTNTSTVSAVNITKGQSVTVTCSATGGTGTRTYGVWYKKSTASSWTKAQDYSTNASVVVTPKYSGEYTISVRVKDGSGKTVRKEFTVNVTVLQTLKNKSSLSAGTIQYGESVTVQGAAEGGAGNLQYAIYAKQEGQNSWTLLRDYSSIPSFVFKPENTGNYTVRIKIRDDEGAVVRKDLLLTVTGEKLVNTSSLAAASIIYGETATINCASSGGYGTRWYTISYRLSADTEWTKLRESTTISAHNFKPSQAGTYQIRVEVKDSNQTTAARTLTLQVTETPLVNQSSLSASSIALGESVRINCMSNGGYGTKWYSISYRLSTAAEWTKLKDSTTLASHSFQPNQAGTYQIRVEVKDSNQTKAMTTLTLRVG